METVADTDAALVLASLERAGELGGDLTDLVYRRLFQAYPEMEALFVRDQNGAVRGEMLARVFEVILDILDQRAYGAMMVACEVVTHEGYGVPPEVFRTFFLVVADAVAESLGATWTPAMDRAWRALLAHLDAVILERVEPA
jgi:hemoglobin-like flavoprotein